MVNQEQAIIYFETGSFVKVEITRAPMVFGAWSIEFINKKEQRFPLSVARSNRLRIFKSIDSAYKVARLVGFRNVLIVGGV